MKRTLKIATRGSQLALWQANHIKTRLEAEHSGLSVELLVLKTRGDKILDVPLAKVGGKGLFVKELETALLNNQADLAVHSMKDVPMDFPQGLGLAVICEREDPRDAFVSNRYENLDQLPNGAVVGTSSLRRQCHLRALRPDLKIEFLRGNVGTRLAKLDEGQYDAIILASAGLIRLQLADRIRMRLGTEQSLPAAGQGAIGIETRTDDDRVIELMEPLHHRETGLCVRAERAMNRKLNGGCQVPIAAFAQLQGKDSIYLRGIVADPFSDLVLTAQSRASVENPETLGEAVADQLLHQGAGEILAAVYGATQ